MKRWNSVTAQAVSAAPCDKAGCSRICMATTAMHSMARSASFATNASGEKVSEQRYLPYG